MIKLAHKKRIKIKNYIRDYVEGVITAISEMSSFPKKKGNKKDKLRDMKTTISKWQKAAGNFDLQVQTLSSIIYRIIILRHKIKMAWFDANCDDKPLKFKGNPDDLTEE